MDELLGTLTYREVAERTGLNHESIRRQLLAGRPSVESVVLLCRAFGVSADWILGVHEPTRNCRSQNASRTRSSRR
ncbi:MAG: helix-turn-helix domain-containing protein [Phycisphaerales bacterium]